MVDGMQPLDYLIAPLGRCGTGKYGRLIVDKITEHQHWLSGTGCYKDSGLPQLLKDQRNREILPEKWHNLDAEDIQRMESEGLYACVGADFECRIYGNDGSFEGLDTRYADYLIEKRFRYILKSVIRNAEIRPFLCDPEDAQYYKNEPRRLLHLDSAALRQEPAYHAFEKIQLGGYDTLPSLVKDVYEWEQFAKHNSLTNQEDNLEEREKRHKAFMTKLNGDPKVDYIADFVLEYIFPYTFKSNCIVGFQSDQNNEENKPTIASTCWYSLKDDIVYSQALQAGDFIIDDLIDEVNKHGFILHRPDSRNVFRHRNPELGHMSNEVRFYPKPAISENGMHGVADDSIIGSHRLVCRALEDKVRAIGGFIKPLRTHLHISLANADLSHNYYWSTLHQEPSMLLIQSLHAMTSYFQNHAHRNLCSLQMPVTLSPRLTLSEADHIEIRSVFSRHDFKKKFPRQFLEGADPFEMTLLEALGTVRLGLSSLLGADIGQNPERFVYGDALYEDFSNTILSAPSSRAPERR